MKNTVRQYFLTAMLLSVPAFVWAETTDNKLPWQQPNLLIEPPDAYSLALPEPTALAKPETVPLPWLQNPTPVPATQPTLITAQFLPTPSAEPQALQTPEPQIAGLGDLQPAAGVLPVPEALKPAPPSETKVTEVKMSELQATPPNDLQPAAGTPTLTPPDTPQPLAVTEAKPQETPIPKTKIPEPQLITAPTEEKYSAFHDMLVYVYQQSPRLKSARYSLKAGDERVSEAVSGFRPTLSANGDIGRQREQTGNQGWVYGTARDESLVLSQPIYNGNGNFAQFHAARSRVSAERAHLITVEEQVFLDAITAYLDAVTKQEILEFTRQNRAHLQNYVTATDKRLKAGDGTRTDLAQAQSRLAQADTSVATAEANWLSACATFLRNTGLPMTSTTFPPLPEGLPDTVDDAVAIAKKAPEFTEAAEQERAASHDIDVASSSLLPTVSLRGTMNSQLTPSLGLQNLRSDAVTLNVSIPLYQGGAEHARVREARVLREKAHEDMVDISHFMTERASQAWHNYYAAYLVIDASAKTTEASSRALQGVEGEHQQGLRTMQDTLDARAEFLNSLIAKAQAEQNLYLQAYRLMAATGQLTAEGMHLGTTLYDPRQHYENVAGKWAGTH